MCPKDEYLSAYSDNEIASPWDKKIESHLAGCERCRQRLAAMKAISARLAHDDLAGIDEAALRVKRRIDFSLSQGLPRYAASGWQAGTHVPFWRRRILLPMPVFAGGFVALLILIASFFFFLGKNNSDLMQTKTELEKLKTVTVLYPVQDTEKVLTMLREKNLYDDVIIQLPETVSFKVGGGPEIIPLNNFKGR